MKHWVKYWIIGAVFAAGAFAESEDPVQWSLASDSAKAAPGAAVTLKLNATVKPGWHLYSLTPTADINPTTIGFLENSALQSVTVYQPKPEKKLDPVLKHEVETYSGEAVFLVRAQLKQDAPPGEATMTAQVRYQACNDKECLRPKKKTAAFALTVDEGAPTLAVFVIPAGYTEEKSASAATGPAAPTAS